MSHKFQNHYHHYRLHKNKNGILSIDIYIPSSTQLLESVTHYTTKHDIFIFFKFTFQLLNINFYNLFIFRHEDPNLNRKPSRKQHFRSNSCDTKIQFRTNDNEFKSNKFPAHRCHSRNNSRDLHEDFRTKLTQTRNNSRDDPQQPQHLNIKFIINQLKSVVKETDQLNRFGESFRLSKKQHKRNNSYDHETASYSMLKNNKNQFSRMSLKDDLNLFKTNAISSNTKDPNNIISPPNDSTVNVCVGSASVVVAPGLAPIIILPECSAANSILRHRRTNSKDLKNQNQSHQRNLSQHKIQIDSNLDGCNVEAAELLLRSTSHENLTSNEFDANQNV